MNALRAAEQEIVVEIIDGTADASHVHIAAPRQSQQLSRVRTLCGTFGAIYLKTGPFAASPWCDQCIALATDPPIEKGAPMSAVTTHETSHTSAATGDSYVARVKALAPAARALDRAKRKLAAGGSNESLKAAFDEALRRANGVPTPENLERLEQASKALRRGTPAREKAQAAHKDAERAFKLALAAIAQDFRS